MWFSNVRSRVIISPIATSIMWLSLMLGKRSARPVSAADVASQARPSWVVYASGAHVTFLPERTPWEPRYKDGTEVIDYRESALWGGARGRAVRGRSRPRTG
jgi:hypothetical protein